MKMTQRFQLVTYSLFVGFVMSQTACIVYQDNGHGRHNGWHKNPNNPHHPGSTNPGKGRGKK
jgi:hypothetical protein